jgi:hypothetical protein
MDPLSVAEYRALRATIQARGGLRLTLSVVGLAAWAAILVALLVWLPNPIAGSIPLILLVVTFEVNRIFHLGIERIGRYLQVFYENRGDAVRDTPAWETTAMRWGPSLPGAGGHPLLLPIFLFATLINFLAVILPGPVPLELGVMAVPHLVFVGWMVWADWSMRRQRLQETKRFQELKAAGLKPGPPAD